jgi:hypothetical protein
MFEVGANVLKLRIGFTPAQAIPAATLAGNAASL